MCQWICPDKASVSVSSSINNLDLDYEPKKSGVNDDKLKEFLDGFTGVGGEIDVDAAMVTTSTAHSRLRSSVDAEHFSKEWRIDLPTAK